MKYLVTYETKWNNTMDWKHCIRPFPIEAPNKYAAQTKFAELFDQIINCPENPTEIWILGIDEA
jgi:hypothetical protein